MIPNNSESDSGGGGKEGAFAIAAIAIVLFFVIKIYSDYVTATGQAVKPGHKRQAASRVASTEEDPIIPSSRRSRADEVKPEDWADRHPKQPARPRDEDPIDEAPRRRSRPAPEDIFPDDSPVRPPGSALPGQIVIEHAPPESDNTVPRALARNSRRDSPPLPRPVDETDSSVREFHVSAPTAITPRTALFRASNPYPGPYDDVQVGDRLSEVTRMNLPGGRLSRSVYTYHPKGGPFKTIVAMTAVGEADPQVTGVVYVFRDSRRRADVKRQAIEAFGEGDAVQTEDGERRQWPHIDGVTASIEPERYMVEQDLTASGRRRSQRRRTTEE